MNITEKSNIVKSIAAQLGFEHCGIAKAVHLDEDARRLENWLHKGFHGKMQYMENHFDLRTDPTKLVPGAKTVITLLKNYFPKETATNPEIKISKYAYGKDYHDVIRNNLRAFHFLLQEQLGSINGRGFVDSAPVLERSWAQLSGLGWIGKNGNLINKKAGSFFFIASLIVDIELEYDQPLQKDFCGTCTQCVDQCPTEAILPNKVIDASKCISYFTIELKDALLPEQMKNKFNNWMFGCDVCQDVCPWNRFSSPTKEPAFEPLKELLHFTSKDWEEMTKTEFDNIFRDSPIKRTKYEGIKRNLKFIQNTHHE